MLKWKKEKHVRKLGCYQQTETRKWRTRPQQELNQETNNTHSFSLEYLKDRIRIDHITQPPLLTIDNVFIILINWTWVYLHRCIWWILGHWTKLVERCSRWISWGQLMLLQQTGMYGLKKSTVSPLKDYFPKQPEKMTNQIRKARQFPWWYHVTNDQITLTGSRWLKPSSSKQEARPSSNFPTNHKNRKRKIILFNPPFGNKTTSQNTRPEALSWIP